MCEVRVRACVCVCARDRMLEKARENGNSLLEMAKRMRKRVESREREGERESVL